jgi:hypothetical protein
MIVLGPPVHHYHWKNKLHAVVFDNGRWSRGVTSVVKHVFAQNYSFKKLRRGSCLVGLPNRLAKRRGHAVDGALSRWTLGQSIQRSRLKEPRALIALFETLGWTPVSAQLLVAWPEARIATKIDLVLQDSATQNLLVVELKTGCLYRRISHGLLSHIVPRVTNAPLYQHQLQTIIGKELLSKTYPTWPRDKIGCVLIYVSSDGGIEMIRECDFALSYTQSMSAILLKTAI